MLECVVNVSEGRRLDVVDRVGAAAGDDLLDVHTCADHHRSVLTLLGEDAPRAVATAAVAELDLRSHTGAHPRIGVLDVVPFVPLGDTTMNAALAARDDFAAWIAETLGVPVFLYGPERSLPDVRRGAFTTLAPDVGPNAPHPSAGAVAVGARRPLVAYNLWLRDSDLATARRLAASLRSPAVRALGLQVGGEVQVSMNLVDPEVVGPADVWDTVSAEVEVARAELVGLLPDAVLHAVAEGRWSELDLASDRTIEWRTARRARRLRASGRRQG
ncbi:MAG TPA: hypothetical protein VIY72_15990 [Acidimicrobiales bacterium]